MNPPVKKHSFTGEFPEGDPDELYQACEAYFSERGWTVEEAVQHGFIPMFDTDTRAQVITTVKRHALRMDMKPLPGYLIDYRNGYVVFRYCCDKDDYPVDVNTGKTIKLAVPSGRAVIPFLPPTIDWDNLPAGTRVYICESALKAASCCRVGLPAIGLNGVTTWSKDKRITPELIKMFRVRGWVPVITFDANAHPGDAHNPSVAKAQTALVKALFVVCGCANVYVCAVPYNTIYDQGIDDYLAAGATAADVERCVYEVDADGTRPLSSSAIGDFVQQPAPIPDPIVTGFISLGECNLLMSPPKVGKTRIALTAAVQIASAQGPLLGIPDLIIPTPRKVLLVVLEDAKYNLQQALKNFCSDLGIDFNQITDTLRVVTGIPHGSNVLVKLDGEVKRFKPDLIIIDNLTRLEMIEGHREELKSLPLLQREYQKVQRFTSWGRDNSVAMLILLHAKKGSAAASTVSDKTNSTGTLAGAADNLASLERITEKYELPVEYRRFVTNARSYRDYDAVLEVSDGPTMYVADWRMLDITAQGQRYLIALFRMSKGEGGYFSAEKIAEALGVRSVQSVRNALGRLVEKGFVNSKEGKDGGYMLSTVGLEAVELKKC